MTQQKRTLFLYCEESLHAGAGSSTGTIDLPIQRERHTNFPIIESSSLRGAIREASMDYLESTLGGEKSEFNRIYGNKEDGSIQSAIDFTDARILFFPVRSYKGVFAWITCPMVLSRLQRDYEKMYATPLNITGLRDSVTDEETQVQIASKLVATDQEVVLEEYLFKAAKEEIKIDETEIGIWISKKFDNANAIIDKLETNIALVSDDVFRDFVELYTHKITRNSIDSETGTAKGMGLFNEEFLPPESILYSFITASDEFSKDKDRLSAECIMSFAEKNLPKLFRAGGDKGIGKGLLRQSILDENINKQIKTS